MGGIRGARGTSFSPTFLSYLSLPPFFLSAFILPFFTIHFFRYEKGYAQETLARKNTLGNEGLREDAKIVHYFWAEPHIARPGGGAYLCHREKSIVRPCKKLIKMERNKYYLGLDVGGTSMVAGVVDEHYRIVAKESLPTRAGRPIEEITADMAEVSKRAAHKAGLGMEAFSSWGIGMPSYVNPKTGLLVHANCFGWKNVPIYNYLRPHVSLPVYIDNDANCAAYGEVLAGGARAYTDAILLTLGTGVGGGIILDKKIYSGSDAMGAELGHTKLVYGGERCTCGQRGCLEAYCSSTALRRIMKEGLGRHPDSLIGLLSEGDAERLNGRILFEAARRGDGWAREIVEEYTGRLAGGLSTFIAIFRPEVILLGGGIAEAGEDLLHPLNEKLRQCTFAAAEIGIPPVIPAELGNDAGIIGAAFLEKNREKNI